MSAIGGLSDPSLRPSMTEPMNAGDDDSAHADLAGMTDEQIAALPAVRRVQYLRALQSGEEEMVADIVVARADRVALIREIGRAYPSMSGSDDFRKGLNKLEWQLDGEDETRVHTVLADDSAAPASESGEWW